MSTPHAPSSTSGSGRLWAGLRSLLVRGWALVIMLVVLWTGYAAVAYLVDFVFTSSRVPAQIQHWQTELTTDDLRMAEVAGITDAQSRAPIDHYHQIPTWFEPDPHNGCTTPGCHTPLPHSRNKTTRAFANFHATFLTCDMCHAAGLEGRVDAVWVDLRSGRKQDAPAMLRLLGVLERADTLEPAELQTQVLPLLRAAIDRLGGHDQLEYLEVSIRTAKPGSPVWDQSMRTLRDELPGHAFGTYGAKLRPAFSQEAFERDPDQLTDLARQYLQTSPERARRVELDDEIHRSIVASPDGCLACHAHDTGRLDFEAVGYTADRADRLRAQPIARMIRQIRRGEPFYLPGFVEHRLGSDEVGATAPADEDR